MWELIAIAISTMGWGCRHLSLGSYRHIHFALSLLSAARAIDADGRKPPLLTRVVAAVGHFVGHHQPESAEMRAPILPLPLYWRASSYFLSVGSGYMRGNMPTHSLARYIFSQTADAILSARLIIICASFRLYTRLAPSLIFARCKRKKPPR